MKPIAQGLGLVLTSCSWLLAQEKPAPPAVPAPASKPAPVATPQAPAAPAAPSPVAKPEAEAPKEIVVQLPAPSFKGSLSVEEGFNTRRSVREFTTDTLKLKDLAQILWAGQGVTMQKEKAPKQWLPKYEYQGGYRTTPSAGGLFPIELYLLAGNVEGLPAGVYKYHPRTHTLKKVLDGNKIEGLSEVALKQAAIKQAQAVLVIAGAVERPAVKSKERAERYTHMEVGAVCQNVYLQCASLGLGTVMIGAFQDQPVKEYLKLPAEEEAYGIMPLGKAKPKEAKPMASEKAVK